jgi:hypothetical protein
VGVTRFVHLLAKSIACVVGFLVVCFAVVVALGLVLFAVPDLAVGENATVFLLLIVVAGLLGAYGSSSLTER